VRNESLVAAVDSPEPSRTFCARPSDENSDKDDGCGVVRRNGDLTGTGGLGRALSLAGRGGAKGLMVSPGDLRSGRGEVCGVVSLVGIEGDVGACKSLEAL
jgi:hypothetical protein